MLLCEHELLPKHSLVMFDRRFSLLLLSYLGLYSYRYEYEYECECVGSNHSHMSCHVIVGEFKSLCRTCCLGSAALLGAVLQLHHG
jgi:hypothetical protein